MVRKTCYENREGDVGGLNISWGLLVHLTILDGNMVGFDDMLVTKRDIPYILYTGI